MAARGMGLAKAGLTCHFCNEFSGGTDNAFAARYGGAPSSRTVLATPNFKIFPTLGQITEGYLLVAPFDHYGALADMPPALIQELAELNTRVRAALSGTYGPCIFFEHGARSENSGGCGIYHAHLHAVPFIEDTEPVSVLRERFGYKTLRSITDIASEANRADSYLYYEDLHSNRYIFEVEYLPSQYMRRLLAEVVGKGEWDWRKYGREEALLSTVRRLSQALGPEPSNPTDAAAANAVAGQPL